MGECPSGISDLELLPEPNPNLEKKSSQDIEWYREYLTIMSRVGDI
jgi:hypothetical protein